MARKRIEISHETEGLIRSLLARGGTVESVLKALRGAGVTNISKPTLARRMAEMRGGVNAERAERAAARRAVQPTSPRPVPARPPADARPFPMTPEEIPIDASEDELRWYEENAKKHADDAAAEGDLKAWGNLARVGMAARQLRLREAPVPKENLDERPDFIKLAAEVEEKFMLRIEQLIGR